MQRKKYSFCLKIALIHQDETIVMDKNPNYSL